MFQKRAFAFGGWCLAFLLVSSTCFSAEKPAEAGAEKPNPVQLSEQEFKLQRALMIEDTARKVVVLQAAHDCAVEAKTADQFVACNVALREAILNPAQK